MSAQRLNISIPMPSPPHGPASENSNSFAAESRKTSLCVASSPRTHRQHQGISWLSAQRSGAATTLARYSVGSRKSSEKPKGTHIQKPRGLSENYRKLNEEDKKTDRRNSFKQARKRPQTPNGFGVTNPYQHSPLVHKVKLVENHGIHHQRQKSSVNSCSRSRPESTSAAKSGQKPISAKQKAKKQLNRKVKEKKPTLVPKPSSRGKQRLKVSETQKRAKDAQKRVIEKLFKGIEFFRDLGRGERVVVRSAVDWVRKRKIAVKVYSKNGLSHSKLANIEREVEILTSLRHPNIIELYEILQSYSTVVPKTQQINLVMEYGGGNSLEQYTKSKPNQLLAKEEAQELFGQLLSAVAYLHSRNIAHRDIRTGNLLVNKHLQLKLIGFGLSVKGNGHASVVPASSQDTTTVSPIMTPEAVLGHPLDPIATDQWSLGLLLYFLLHGHRPFEGASNKELNEQIVRAQIPCRSDIDPAALQLLKGFLQPDPQNRLDANKAMSSRWILQARHSNQSLKNEFKQRISN